MKVWKGIQRGLSFLLELLSLQAPTSHLRSLWHYGTNSKESRAKKPSMSGF